VSVFASAGLALTASPGDVYAQALAPQAAADALRGFGMVSLSTSEQPALREERRVREPSAGFLLGSALAAWINAAAQLDFDLKNPAGVGPPHVALGGENTDYIAVECREEQQAFVTLESRRQDLSLPLPQAASFLERSGAEYLTAWKDRQSGAPAGCAGR
jgi:hypothetical protein